MHWAYLESVGEDHDELNHLEVCEVFLPPDKPSVARSHSSQHVVGVHDDVDKGVDQTEESAVATCRHQKGTL